MYPPEPRRRRPVAALVCICGLSCALPAPAARPQVLSTPELLVHLARDYALNRSGRQTAADVLHVKTLLRAAVRLDPRLTRACAWLCELSALAGEQQPAAEALEKLLAADPAHEGAFALWLETRLKQIQTAEQRRGWLESLLEQPRPPRLQSLVCARLARLAFTRLERLRARQYLEQARRRDPLNPDIALIELDLLARDARPQLRLQVALRALGSDPARVELAWQVGQLLDEYGFAEQAGRFYEHALAVHAAAVPARPIPADKLLQLARNELARGHSGRAIARAVSAVRSGSRWSESSLYLHWLLSHYGRQSDAQAVRQALEQHFAKVRQPADWPVGEVAQAAWYYCFVQPDPQRALALADAAARRVPGDPFVTRVLGWAQALNQRSEDARRTLAPVATRDPFAAYELAKLLRDAGEARRAAAVLRGLDAVPASGPAAELLEQLALAGPATRPASERHPSLARVLAEFDFDLLEFCRDPARFLTASITLENLSPAPGEPWWAICSLSNRARFPITLGPDRMVNPVFLLSFTTEGDRRRSYPHLITLSLDRQRLIPPGSTARIRRAINLGPLRRISRQTPQQLQRITLRAILDPEQRPDGTWQPAIGGQRLKTVYFNRIPASTTAEAFHALFGALRGESQGARFRALEVMAELLGESQRARLARLAYRPDPVPARRIEQALLAALRSESWEIRVRALDALQAAGLDARLLAAAEACLRHPHWLVRLMALRLLARRGPDFAASARRIAARDEDELVRALASACVQRWTTTQPATAPLSAPGGGASQAIP